MGSDASASADAGRAERDGGVRADGERAAGRGGATRERVVLGIDEAGRGPVLGPMVYAAAACPVSRRAELVELGFNDSKLLTPQVRDKLFTALHESGFLAPYVESISAEELSAQMLSREHVSLNQISHRAAISLVKRALADGLEIEHLYVDTVGDPARYERILQDALAGLPVQCITVSTKADAKYPIVGAASVVAKVTRDRALQSWDFQEQRRGAPALSRDFGSGYPADPVCKAWLRTFIDPIFGFTSLVRFSWATARTLLDKHAVAVAWAADEPSDDCDVVSAKRSVCLGAATRGAAAPRSLPVTAFFGPLPVLRKPASSSTRHRPHRPQVWATRQLSPS
uniref:Ribonuclease n=1 Tax=Erythrolobus australicus TaxID=1077150 RepID=A0A7S1XJS4_9RHOD